MFLENMYNTSYINSPDLQHILGRDGVITLISGSLRSLLLVEELKLIYYCIYLCHYITNILCEASYTGAICT